MATTHDGLREVHRRFCELLPDDLLWVEDPETKERIRVVPGALRDRDVAVGRRLPVSPGALPRFLARFEHAYAKLGKTDAIIAPAYAHHRLLWAHPFLDDCGSRTPIMSCAPSWRRKSLNWGGRESVIRTPSASLPWRN